MMKEPIRFLSSIGYDDNKVIEYLKAREDRINNRLRITSALLHDLDP